MNVKVCRFMWKNDPSSEFQGLPVLSEVETGPIQHVSPTPLPWAGRPTGDVQDRKH